MLRSKLAMGFLWALVALALHVIPGMVAPGRAQGTRKDDIVFNSRGTPLAGATVRVCAMPAIGQPCTPLALIYSDAGLTQAIANPTTTDGLGNYFFYAAPGQYEIEISGPQIKTKQIPNVILPADPTSPTFTGAINAFSLNLSGNLTVNGNTTVIGNLASGTLSLSNQATPPGAASPGTVNLYSKTADKRLYYTDETGTEIGPISVGGGVQLNTVNTFTAQQNIDSDFHTKGPNPSYDVTRFGAYLGAAIPPTTTCSTTSGSANMTCASAIDFVNGNGIVIYGAGAAPSFDPWGQTTIRQFARNNNVATYTLSSGTAIGPGQSVTISGLSDGSFNVTCTVINGGASTFTCSNAGSNVSTTAGTGTATIASLVVAVTPVGVLNGTTNWNYKIVLRDSKGGLSVASPSGGTTTGVATLGVNTVGISSITRANGITTVTTTVAHNFQSGVPVNIAGLTGPNGEDTSLEGQFTIASTPSSTTFTYPQSGAPDETGTVSGGSAKVIAKNLVQWNMQPYSVMQSIIYRCSTSCGTNTNYTIAGVTQGMDGSFVDWGFTFSPSSLPSYIPANPPAAATNQMLATTIVSGGGTTNLTLATAASNTVTNQAALHDNGPNVLLACAAMNNQGGTVYIPSSNPSGMSSVFNSPLNLSTCPHAMRIQFGAVTRINEPILPLTSQVFEGLPQGAAGQIVPFEMDYAATIFGKAYPFFYLLPGTAGENTFINLNMECSQPYQTCVLQDQDAGGDNVTNISYRNVFFDGQTGSFPFLMKGGFGFYFDRGGFNSNNLAWGNPELLTDEINLGLGAVTQQLAYTVVFDKTYFAGGGIVFDAFGQSALGSQPVFLTSNHTLIESSRQPVIRYNVGNAITAQITFLNTVYADFLGGAATPLFDLTNAAAVSSFNAINPSCSNSNQPVFGGATGGVTVINGSFGCNIIGSTTYTARQGASNNQYDFYNNVPIQLNGSNAQIYYSLAPPSAPAVNLGSGGTIPVGTVSYSLVGVDVNGALTTMGPAATVMTTPGNQTVTVTPPTLPSGTVGYLVYRSVGSIGFFRAGTPSCLPLAPNVSFVDSFSFGCGNSPPYNNTAAISYLGVNGLSAPQLRMVNKFTTTVAPATLTGNRTQTLPDATGYIPVTSYVNSAYDNATRANGAIGSNWTLQQNGFNIASNQIQGSTPATSNTAFWNANSFSPVQFSQATITALNGTADYPGVTVLASSTGFSSTYYDCVENSTTIYMQRIVSAATTNLTSASSTGNVGDILRLEVGLAGALTCYKNGVAALTATDTQITSGAPGLLISGNVATEKNWSGGNLHPLSQLDVEADYTKVQHLNAGVAIGSETFTASPRSEQNAFLPGALTSSWTGSTWTLDKSLTVTRVQVQAKTAPAGCSTNAIVQVTDGTNPVNVTISAAASDSGPIAQNYAAGASLQVLVQTAAAGCTTSPADANVIVQYRMQ